ncbi:MAG: cytochrome c [Solimonas sp.]
MAAVLVGTSPAQAADGADAYARRCAACHQPDGAGAVSLAPPLRTPVFKKLGTHAPGYIVSILLAGMVGQDIDGESYVAAMPDWSALSDEEIAAIARFVLADFNDLEVAVTPEEVAASRKNKLQSEDIIRLRSSVQ